ncbi:MAG TPA: hypothetical protein VFJ14_06350, partial [Nocardioidaceae bacterium]|nr:hypothetical protein [Nocardioidaceae bacterium]
MPVLSSGKHRNPRKGACFMELASYLAGERWSDHPKCTHPLVGVLAREVNDHVSDANRARLAPLIPDVVGLTGTDPRVTAWIARDAALMALPIGAAERQGVSAVGILRCEQVLNALEGRPRNYVSPRSAAALAAVPRAHRWALQFSRMGWGEARNFGKRSAPTIVHCAVVSISEACVDDPDDRLVTLLTETIQRCRQWFAIAGEP